MVPFGVEGPGHGLDVGESGPVLDVQQRATLEIPRDDIGTTRELVVLVWLVDTHSVAQAAQVHDLDLTHRRSAERPGATALIVQSVIKRAWPDQPPSASDPSTDRRLPMGPRSRITSPAAKPSR